MPAPNSQQNPQSRIHSSNTLQSVGEVNGRVDQLALVQQALQDGATPTMIAGFAMIVAQMQAQAAHPEVLLIITSSIGPLERSATFRDGVCHGYDLTHNLIDPRSHMLYGEPDRPPVDQERSFRISPPTIHPMFQPPQPTPPQAMVPLPPSETTTFSCILPQMPPPILTPPMPLASVGINPPTPSTSAFMLPSAFQGGGVQASPIECNRVTQEQANETRPTRKVTFQDSYEELTPSTSNPQPARNEPSRLIGFQKDPKLHERQKEEQREERKASNAPIDLRDMLNATKRAREQDGQTSSNRGSPASSPSQPEARRQRVTRELLTTAEMKQLDITARDALRLQREIPNMPDEEEPTRQKFASANSKGDQTTQRTVEKANIGVVYNRPVKPPVFTNDGGVPPWFERLRRELQNSNSTYMQPLQTTIERLARQRPGRFGENHLQSKNYARNPITLLPMGKDLLQKTRIALFVDSTIKSSYNSNNTLMVVRLMNMPCTTLNEMAEVTDKIFTPAAAETIPLPPILVYSNVIDHLALRESLRHFDTQSNRFTEGFVTDEVTAYIETMSYIATMMKNKKPNTATVFVSPPGYIHLPRALQQFLYLVLEAAYARDLQFYIVAPNLRINVTTWRPCEASYPAFLAEVSKAIQAFTGYRGNSQLIVDEATAYDYGMQMSIRSLDENGVRKVFDPNENQRKHLIDNLWFERRDESTLDEKTHEPKFHKELLALFKETEKIKTERTNTTVFPMVAISTDARLDMASLT